MIPLHGEFLKIIQYLVYNFGRVFFDDYKLAFKKVQYNSHSKFNAVFVLSCETQIPRATTKVSKVLLSLQNMSTTWWRLLRVAAQTHRAF